MSSAHFISIKPMDVTDYSHVASGCTHFIVKTKENIYKFDLRALKRFSFN